MFLSLLYFVLACYVLFIARYVFGLYKIKPEINFEKNSNITSFTILIPFKNEFLSVKKLLQNFENVNYPKANFQVILIADYLSENDFNILKNEIKRFRFINIIKNNQKPGKKGAIYQGVIEAEYDYIIQIDADVTIDENILQAYNQAFISKNPALVLGTVCYMQPKWNLLHVINYYEYESLQAITFGAVGQHNPMFGSGANLAYKKEVFLKLYNELNNVNSVSGDDVFLVQYVHKHSGEIYTSLKAKVYASPPLTWNNYINQRIRWGAKTTKYVNPEPKLLAVITLLTNISISVLYFYTLFNLKFLLLLTVISIKITTDFWLLKTWQTKKNNNKIGYEYIIAALIYPFINTVSGIFSIIGSYSWKGKTYFR